MEFQPKKLYHINECYWFLYPNQNHKGLGTCTHDVWRAEYIAVFYSVKYNEQITYIPSKTIIYCIEQDHEMIHVLSPEGNGWINVPMLKTYEKYFTMLTG